MDNRPVDSNGSKIQHLPTRLSNTTRKAPIIGSQVQTGCLPLGIRLPPPNPWEQNRVWQWFEWDDALTITPSARGFGVLHSFPCLRGCGSRLSIPSFCVLQKDFGLFMGSPWSYTRLHGYGYTGIYCRNDNVFYKRITNIDATEAATSTSTLEEVDPLTELASFAGDALPAPGVKPVESWVGPGVGEYAVTAAHALLPLIVELVS